jgi:DNA-binding MarR family transcriptional regulator
MKIQPTCVCVNLRRAARAMTALYDQALADSGLKITQFSLLRAVQRGEPIAIGVLAELLELDRTTLARNLRPLERDRLVELSGGDDQRVTEVSLTAAGNAAIAAALPLWRNAQSQIGARLGSERVEQLRAVAQQASEVVAQISSDAQRKARRRAK